MKYTIQKSIYPITFLFIVFFSGCHSLPPSEPPDTEQEFDVRGLPWEEVSMPVNLTGDWYRQGEIYLTVAEDTLRVQGNWSLIQSINSADSYYRIIYKIGAMYYSMYLRNLTSDDVQIVHADSTAVNEERASAIPVTGLWQTLTSTNPWIATGMPVELPGNWHIRDGEMETVIDPQSVVVDGESWDIDSVQTNRTVERLILRSGERYKSFYFQEVGEYTMGALLVDGKEDIQDRYGKVLGDWITFYKWWDLFEIYPFTQGARWTYIYSYQEYYIQVYNQSSPIDSIVQERQMVMMKDARFEIEVTANTLNESESGSLNLQATFRIDQVWNRYYHAQIDSVTRTVADSQWFENDIIETCQYELFLENDTLWFNTEEGKVFFASRKDQLGSLINIRAFIFPFTFPKEGFPEGRDVLGKINLSYLDLIPVPDWLRDWRDEGSNIVLGSTTDTDAFIWPGKGVVAVYYLHGDYNRPIYQGPGQYSIPVDPFIKETFFECQLLEFAPGQ